LPSKLYKDLTSLLKENGCKFKRQASGSHEIWINPENNKQTTVATSLESKILAKKIKSQLGL